MKTYTLEEAFDAVKAEVLKGRERNGPLNSIHEALGVMFEEFDEFCDEVRNNDRYGNLHKEAIQVAAVAISTLMDHGWHENDSE